MAAPATLQDTYKQGMKRDGAREALAQGACWNVVDFLPEALGAVCRKRGGYRWASQDLAVVNPPSYSTVCGIVAEFTAGQSVLVQDVPGRIYEIESPTATEIIAPGAAALSRNPIFYNDMAIFPDRSGAIAPSKVTRAGATHTVAVLAGTPPAGKYALVYKDVMWLGGANATPKRIHFSVAGNPQSWDTTTKWWDLSYPITGFAALSNAVLVFSLQRTARFRGSKPPPGTDLTLDDPVFEVGCTDNRSIQNYRDKCIFANAQGIYMTDGVALEDLTRVCGMKNWWRDVMKGREGFATGTPYNLSNWILASGIYDDFYFYSIVRDDTGQCIDAGVIDLTRYAWTRLSNFNAAHFFDRLYPQELFLGHRLFSRIGTISDIFLPTSTNEVDATGETILPYIETGFFGAQPGVKTFSTAFVTYDLSGGSAPVLRVSVADSPEAASYTPLVPDLGIVGQHVREHLEINRPGLGLAFKIAQIGQSTDTRLHQLEVVASPEIGVALTSVDLEHDIREVERLLSRPEATPNEFSTWIINWLVANMDISGYQLRGLASTFFQAATVIAATESTASGTFTNLASVGPTLSGLGNGQYLAFWGANLGTTSSDTIGLMGMSPNGSTPSDEQAAKGRIAAPPEQMPILYSRAYDLRADDKNFLQCKYMKAAGNAGSDPKFHNRWLVAVQIER